jgi:hypothetical protein
MAGREDGESSVNHPKNGLASLRISRVEPGRNAAENRPELANLEFVKISLDSNAIVNKIEGVQTRGPAAV